MNSNNKPKYSPRFIRFLIAFGVKGTREYETFTKAEQTICMREYLKRLKDN